jgi:hypothetical protein
LVTVVLALAGLLAAASCGHDAKGSGSSQPAAGAGLARILDQPKLGSLATASGPSLKPTTDAQTFAVGNGWLYNVEPGDAFALGKRLQQHGFVAGASRFYGRDPNAPTTGPEPLGVTATIELRDAAAARAEADAQFKAAFKACPGGPCATAGELPVEGIAGVQAATFRRDVRGERMYEYMVVFAKGPVAAQVYASSLKKDGMGGAVVSTARTLYDRLPAS